MRPSVRIRSSPKFYQHPLGVDCERCHLPGRWKKRHFIMEKRNNFLVANTISPASPSPQEGGKGEILRKRGFLRKGARIVHRAVLQKSAPGPQGVHPRVPTRGNPLQQKPGVRVISPQAGRARGAIKAGCAYIYISSSANNTLYTLTDSGGRVRVHLSAGGCGFKNTRKSTGYASQATAERLASMAKRWNFRQFHLKICGLGPGKLSGVRALGSSGLRIVKLSECTGLPHNGCRPPKNRRI